MVLPWCTGVRALLLSPPAFRPIVCSLSTAEPFGVSPHRVRGMRGGRSTGVQLEGATSLDRLRFSIYFSHCHGLCPSRRVACCRRAPPGVWHAVAGLALSIFLALGSGPNVKIFRASKA